MTQQALALAGVLQATELVRQAARHGTWSGYAASASLASVFRLESANVDEIYGDRQRMRLGLETVHAVFSGTHPHAESLQHAVCLLRLQKPFTANRAMLHTSGEALSNIIHQIRHMEPHEAEEYQAEQLAALYKKTVSQLRPRILVQGNPQYLQAPRTIAWIRALLFAGLRSAVLWRQSGGGRFSLIFGRRRILQQTEALLGS